MKIGLISDIHADLKSLKIALDILQGQQVEQVICCGDLVSKGPEGDAVVRLIREHDIPCVMGNHDYMASGDMAWLMEKYSPSNPRRLANETLEYLGQLPNKLRFVWEGKTVLVAHGTPWSYDDYLYPYSPRKTFELVLAASLADVVILGHTHDPMMASINDKWVFNPGSVCGFYIQGEGSSTCATLSLPDMTFRLFDIRTSQRIQPAYVEYS